jgi:acyl-CoA reductase-like NAD-dependent aldehyde dehydrogenase
MSVAASPELEHVSAPALAEAIAALRRERLGRQQRPTYTQRLAALHALSDALLTRDPELLRVLPMTGLAFAAAFLRSTNLEHLVARELPHVAALDQFTRIEERKSLRILPRGVAGHWIAGNVPLLGLFSWALSALAGNVNVVRLSSRMDDFLTPILRVLARSSAAGAELAADTLAVRFATEDEAAHRAMSLAADVRIAWGGREAVEAIAALPTRWDCETVILGPRMSMAVVDADLLTDRVLSRLASDIAYFDQQACSSPQWVFVKRPRRAASFDEVVARFVEAFAAQARALGRHRLDFGETYRIELDRARVLIDGAVLHRDAETAWTVVVLDAPDTRVACANRFVQVIPFDDVDEIGRFIPGNAQTVVMLLDRPDSDRFSESAAQRGVQRFARPGEGNHFETPWDGTPLMSRLTRWTIRTEAAMGAESTTR